MKNLQGFTLVELMVVVAIIGILSAVAIPNFKSYQAKAKTSEAKLQLSALYSAETAFNGDYDTYATCLKDMGYEQPGKGYYFVGFPAAVVIADGNAVINGAPKCDMVGAIAANHDLGFAQGPVVFTKVGNDNVAAVPANIGLVAIGVSGVAPVGGTFIAGAVAKIVPDAFAAVANDGWTIDQTKNLVNGIKNW